MNILVLGGNGYLGSKVSKRLVKSGHSVVCTKRNTSDLSRIGEEYHEIKWIPATIEAVEAAMQYMNFDYVINMACNYGRSYILYDNVIESNIEFPLKVLNSAVEHGTKNFITIGTGLPDELNMYSFSKKIFNEFGLFYVNNHAINFNCLVLEMFYGADEPTNRFLPSIILKMIKGEQVDTTIGSQHRDIIWAEDIVKAILAVFDATPKGYHEIQVGTGIAPSISEVVDFIWNETGNKSVVNKGAIPMRKNEPDCKADTSFISSLCDWNPVFWKDGIRQMIIDIQKNLEERNENID